MQKNEQALKRCSICKRLLALSGFSRDRSRPAGRDCRCKQCFSALKRARFKTPDHLVKESQRSFRRKYGITWDDKRALFDGQGGLCAWCKGPLPDWHSKRVHLDHCHTTGLIRGVVHNGCNREIASFEAVHARGVTDPVAHFTAYQLAAEFRQAA